MIDWRTHICTRCGERTENPALCGFCRLDEEYERRMVAAAVADGHEGPYEVCAPPATAP